MKVKQFKYLSPEAKKLRTRDGTPPWGVHPCEVDHLKDMADVPNALGSAWHEAAEIRRQLESRNDQ